jgi:Predicted membrane protein (DUF2306)
MSHVILRLKPIFPAIVAVSRWLIFASVGAFVAYTSMRGMAESFDNDGFPEALAIKVERLPVIFPVHMITGGLALLLVPLVLALRGTRWHKLAGRIAAVDILIAGATALPVALQSPVTKLSAAGFTAQAVIWMTLLGFGLWHIRNHRITRHQNCMLLMAAVTSGAMFFRIYLGLWKAYGVPGYFYTFYAIDAWIAWGLPLLVMVLVVKRRQVPATA